VATKIASSNSSSWRTHRTAVYLTVCQFLVTVWSGYWTHGHKHTYCSCISPLWYNDVGGTL